MRVAMTSVAAQRPGRVNEDFAGAVPAAAVVVDGAGIPGGEAICRHGVAWYAHRLGGTLLRLLTGEPERGLPSLLAEAVERVTGEHRGTCDVTDPVSPSATVAVLRVSGGRVDHLVLGDCVVVLDRVGAEPVVVSDLREVEISRAYESLLAAAPAGGDEYHRLLRELRAHRNRPGGFWVAKDDPRAAGEAVTGTCRAADLAGAALLSNGASRVVDRFALAGWPEVLTVLGSRGPAEIIRWVRRAEGREAVAPDDATIVHCTRLGDS